MGGPVLSFSPFPRGDFILFLSSLSARLPSINFFFLNCRMSSLSLSFCQLESILSVFFLFGWETTFSPFYIPGGRLAPLFFLSWESSFFPFPSQIQNYPLIFSFPNGILPVFLICFPDWRLLTLSTKSGVTHYLIFYFFYFYCNFYICCIFVWHTIFLLQT